MEQLIIPEDLRGSELTNWLVNKRDELLSSIITNQEEVEKFLRLWDSNLQLHQYSINNIILAYFQYPKVSMLAGFKKWISLNRTVRKGSKAIKVLAPLKRKVKVPKEDKEDAEDEYYLYGFRYVNVFDVSMTEGENLDFGHTDKIKGRTLSFKVIKKISPLPVVVEYMGTANGSVNSKRIQIAPKDNEASMMASFCHELGHYYLGHLEGDMDRETKEVEAETVSHIVTTYLGLDNNKSKYYLAAWNGKNKNGRANKVVAVAERIIRDLQKLN